MKKRYWIVLFILIGLISLGLVAVFNKEDKKIKKCNSGELIPGKVALVSHNSSATSIIKLFLKSENFEYLDFKERYNLPNSEWSTFLVNVPVLLENYYLQKIENSLIKEGLSSTDFIIVRDSITCLDDLAH